MRLILSIVFLCLFVAPALSQETAPGAACTAGQTNHVRQSGGPETSGIMHLMRCDGSTWTQYLTVTTGGSLGLGTVSPQDNLDIHRGDFGGISLSNAGSTSSSSSYLALYSDRDDLTKYLGQDNTSKGWYVIVHHVSSSAHPTMIGDLAFMHWNGAAWQTNLVFQSTGNVGIATVNPRAALDVGGSVALSADLTPAQITGNQNNYNPANLSTASVLRLSSDAARDITGLAGGADGRALMLLNVGSSNIVLKNQNASSTAANRFAFGTDLTLAADQSLALIYDSTSQRWRAAGLPFDSAAGGGLSGPAGCANIGDLCADGTVFAGYHPITQAHLFIPTTNQGTTSAWKTSTGTNDIATDSNNDGRANTNQVANSTTFPAFKLCKDLGTGGHSDWYLPSMVELFYLWSVYGTIQAGGNITNFGTQHYSSTEYDSNTAWVQDFSDGQQYAGTKSDVHRVRCVRR